MKKSLAIALVLVPFCLGVFIADRATSWLTSIPALQNYISNTLVLSQYRRYEAFDPSVSYKKYGFLSSSFYAQTGVYNRPNGKLLRHPDGYIGRIANYILDQEYNSDVRFYDVGRSATNAFNHLWFMSNFVHAPGADLVFYTNGYTSLDKPYTKAPRSLDNYVAMEVLKELKKRYPKQTENIALLEEYISQNVDLDLSKSAELVDSRTKLYFDCYDQYPKLAFRTTECSFTKNSLPKLRNNLGSKLLRWFDEKAVKPARGKENLGELPELYTLAVAEYDAEKHDKPNIINAAAVRSAEVETNLKFEHAYYDLLLGITEAEGLKFVFYYPPMYELPPDQYWAELKPFIDHLRDRYKDRESVYFIDHTFLPTINHFDAYYRKRGQCEGLCKKNHNLGIIGNVKRIRALFDELQELDLLEVPEKEPGTAFKEEPDLPQIEMCFKIIGLDAGQECIYRPDDYLPDSVASRTPLAKLYPDAKITNDYVRNKFYR